MLVCKFCHQIPYIIINQNLKVNFSCCHEKIISLILLKETIDCYYTLKCENCDEEINKFENDLLCEKCMNKNEKKKDLFNYCIFHKKKYLYYQKDTNYFLCEKCINNQKYKDSYLLISDLKNTKIEEIKKFNFKEVFSSYQELYYLTEKIINTYHNNIENIKSNLNYNNLLKFTDLFLTESLLCSKCYETYKLTFYNLDSIKIKCNCGEKIKLIVNFIKDIKEINCNLCNKKFKQYEIFLEFFSEELKCKNCLKDNFDYIPFNQIPFICKNHNQIKKYLSENNNNSYCEKCLLLNNNENFILRKVIIYDINLKYNISNQFFINLLKNDYLKMKETDSINLNIIFNLSSFFSFNEKNKYEKYVIDKEKLKRKENILVLNSLKEQNNLKSMILTKIQIFLQQLKEKPYENDNLELDYIKQKVENLIEINLNQFKYQFMNYNYFISNILNQLLIIRNILLQSMTSVLKNNKNSFMPIIGNLRILFESFNYIYYEIKIKKNKKEVYYEFLNKIFENISHIYKIYLYKFFFEKLKNKTIKKFKDLKPESIEKKPENDFHSEKIKSLLPNIFNENDKINIMEQISTSSIKNYFDKEKTISVYNYSTFNIFRKLFYLNQDLYFNYNYQHIHLKMEEKECNSFLQRNNFKSEYHFYFIYNIIHLFIKKIGGIIHQNDINYFNLYNSWEIILKDLNNNKKFESENDLIKQLFNLRNTKNIFNQDLFTLISKNDKDIFNKIEIKLEEIFSKIISNFQDILSEEKKNNLIKKSKEEIIDKFKKNNLRIKKNIEILYKKLEYFYNFYYENKDLILFYNNIKKDFELSIIEYNQFKNLDLITLNISSSNINSEDFLFLENILKSYLAITYLKKEIKDYYLLLSNQKEEYKKLIKKNYNYLISKEILLLLNIENNYDSEHLKIVELIYNKIKLLVFEELKQIKREFNLILNSKEEINIYYPLVIQTVKFYNNQRINNSKLSENWLREKIKIEIDKLNEFMETFKDYNFYQFFEKIKSLQKDLNILNYSYPKFDVLLYLIQHDIIQ